MAARGARIFHRFQWIFLVPFWHRVLGRSPFLNLSSSSSLSSPNCFKLVPQLPQLFSSYVMQRCLSHAALWWAANLVRPFPAEVSASLTADVSQLQWVFSEFGCQCQPKTLRYFKQYGAEASGSLIHPHMQNLGRDSEYNRETIWRSFSWFSEFNDQKQETYKHFIRSKLYISPLISIHSHLAALGISVVRICSLPIVSRSLEKRLQDCGKMRSKVWQISLSYLGSILVGSRSKKCF